MPQSITGLQKMLFFASLYFLQGAAFAYVVNFQKPYLAGEGVSKSHLGLFTSLLLLPFIFKIFLGMLSDRVPIGRWGSRKPYMVLGLLIFSGCYGVLSTIESPAQNFVFFASVTWLASLGLALFDTCCDGLAIDVATEEELGLIQGAMVAGRSLGLIVMAAAFGWLVAQSGVSFIFMVLAGLAFLFAWIVLFVRFEPVVGKSKKGNSSLGWSELTQPAFLFLAIFGMEYSISSFGTDGIGSLFLSEVRHIGPEGLGAFGAARGAGALIGAGIFAWASRRMDLNKLVAYSVLGLGIGCLTFLLELPVVLAGLIWGLFWGAQETAYVTLAMRFAKGPWSATFFAVAMIFSNIGTAVGEGLAAPLAAEYGYQVVFTIFAVLSWLLLPVLRRL